MKLSRYEKSPLGIAEKKLKEFTDFADKHVLSKIPPLDIPKLMEDPTIKTITNLAQDDKVQKTFKNIMEQGPKLGNELNKGLEKLGDMFKPK